MNATDVRIRADITRVAADWFAAHRAGTLTQSDRADFLAWLKASPLHVEEYLGIAAIERTLAAAAANPSMSAEDWIRLADGAPPDTVVALAPPAAGTGASDPQGGQAPTAAGRRCMTARLAAAAAVAGLAVVLVRAPWHSTDAPAWITSVSTARGEQRTLTLVDGSTLRANTDTAATVRISGSERIVSVERGQVALDVAHDAHRPLHVRAGDTDVVAVGTAFDVYRHAESTQITVMKGQVQVAVSRRDALDRPKEATPRTLRVNPGQQVTVVGGLLPAAPQTVDLRQATAWLDRKIVFERRPLAAVAEEFNRYNAVQFHIDDPAVRGMAISGSFDAADPESFAAFLESLDGVDVRRSGDRIVVSAARSGAGPSVRRS